MRNEEINTPQVPDGTSAFHPHARIVGDFIYVSGLIARRVGENAIPGVDMDHNGKVISYNMELQVRATMENLKHILKSAGSSLENVIDITVFLTDIGRDFKEFNKIYGEYFNAIKPCRTTVEVTRFPSPVNIEIKCIAIK
jgi:2-aminomuconate deaminase